MKIKNIKIENMIITEINVRNEEHNPNKDLAI